MSTESILRHLGFIFLFQAFFLFIAFLISAFLFETSTVPLLFSFVSTTIFGTMFILFTHRVQDINFAEGIAIVVFGWLATCIIGALPYTLWGGEFSVTNAWFEECIRGLGLSYLCYWYFHSLNRNSYCCTQNFHHFHRLPLSKINSRYLRSLVMYI